MNILQRIKLKIKLWNEYNNPFYVWWKTRKYFKFPSIHFIIGKNIWFFGLYINRNYYNKIFDICTKSVGFKFKFDDVRYEWNPYINICLFRKYHFIILFQYDIGIINTLVWETMLNMVYNNMTFKESVKYNSLTDYKGNKLGIRKYLTKYGIKQL